MDPTSKVVIQCGESTIIGCITARRLLYEDTRDSLGRLVLNPKINHIQHEFTVVLDSNGSIAQLILDDPCDIKEYKNEKT